MIYSFWLHQTAQSLNCGCVLVSYSCNAGLEQLIPAAFCLAGIWLVAKRSILLVSPFSCVLSCSWSWSTTVIESRPLSPTSLWYSEVRGDKTNPLPHSSLDCLAALQHTEIGKVTLMREIPTVNHRLPELFTHSLKGSPFKFDQYQPKRSQRVTQRSGY